MRGALWAGQWTYQRVLRTANWISWRLRPIPTQMMCHYAILDAFGDCEATTRPEPSPTPKIAATAS
jgi:hypothetical protein